MTQAENRAAAKAFREEQEAKRREAARLEAVNADLAQLEALRNYLIFRRQSEAPADALISAIDDYVEKLTGDRTKLHAPHHSIG